MSRMPVLDERMRHRRESVASADVRRRRRRFTSLAAVVGLLIAAALVARSPLFSVTDVHVQGVATEREQDVRDAAAIRTGDNLLDVDLGSAAARVTALPWVADAEARRSPPSAVTVQVTPRPPVAVAHVAGAAWLLDGDGVVIAGGSGEDLPVIEAPEAQLPPLGETVTEEAVRNALAVHAALPPAVRDRVDGYEAPSVPGLRLRLTGPGGGEGVWVRFGAAEQVEAKARAIGLLLEELERADRGSAGEAPENDGSGEDGSEDDGFEEEGLGESFDPSAVELDVRAPDNPVLVPDGEL